MSHPGAQNAESMNGQDPTVQPQNEPTGGEPAPLAKSRVWVWISLVIAVVVIAAAAVATSLIIGGVDQGDAEREYGTAQADVEEARADLATALQTATAEAEASQAVMSSLPADLVSDDTVFEQLQAAQSALAASAGLTVDAEAGVVVADEPSLDGSASSASETDAVPSGSDELRAAAEHLRDEAAVLRDEMEAIDQASQSLWAAQLGVVESVQRKGAELLAEAASSAGAEETESLQTAIDALSPEGLTRGESDLGVLLDDLNAAWEAAQGSMVPTWDKAAGTWCGDHGCDVRVEYPVVWQYESPWDMGETETMGGCLYAPLSTTRGGYGGSPGITYCPAGVATPYGMMTQPLGAPGTEYYDRQSDDQSQDRVFTSDGIAQFRQ